MEYKARDGETDAGFLMEKFHAQQQIPTLLNNWGQLLSTIFFSLLFFFKKKTLSTKFTEYVVNSTKESCWVSLTLSI